MSGLNSDQIQNSRFSYLDRGRRLQRLANEEFDLVIIGGGITGAGAARDAASRGMKVALIEAKDFAVGTSSRSSKLIHGGIRYLENLEFHLVFEALSERRLLFELAPHLVHPLRFVLPLYRGGRVGMFKMGLGMWLYDALSMFEAPELHERLVPEEALERLPLLQANGLLGAYEYSDAYMDDDRLVLETMRSATKMGAVCESYVKAVGAELINGKVVSLECEDALTGTKMRVRGKHFVSTVGPWTDAVATKLLHDWQKIMRPSKGIHLTFKRDRLKLEQAVVMAADNQKRIVFGIPRHEMIIIGTTDTDYSGDPYDVSVSAADVQYLMKVANEYFPGAQLTTDDIVASYAGVRPLVDDGAETESKTSREHIIVSDPRNVTFVAGGKYTTYRLMAEQTIEAALETFSLEDRVRFTRNDTKRPLNDLATAEKMDEAYRMAEKWSTGYRLPLAHVRLLIDRHGGEALEILRRGPGAGFEASGVSEEKLWALEARHAILNLNCFSLVDFYVRRSPLFLSRPDHGLSLVAGISRIFARELDWTDAQRQQEAASIQAHVRKEFAWRNELQLAPAPVSAQL